MVQCIIYVCFLKEKKGKKLKMHFVDPINNLRKSDETIFTNSSLEVILISILRYD